MQPGQLDPINEVSPAQANYQFLDGIEGDGITGKPRHIISPTVQRRALRFGPMPCRKLADEGLRGHFCNNTR